MSYRRRLQFVLPYVLCVLFFVAYGVLSIIRHNHYQSFGYDLGINDQAVWLYSHFKLPVTTIDPFPTRSKLVEHIELIYPLLSPFYWLWNSRKMLLLLQPGVFCSSGLVVYWLAKQKKLHPLICFALVTGYLAFYGVQNAIWADVHSATFAAAFLMWFVYFLERKKNIPAIIFFLLAITAKENIALLTLLAAAVLFLKQRRKIFLFFMAVSTAYLLFVYLIYFPYIIHMSYLYANSDGLLSNLNPLSMIDTGEKRQVIGYSLLSYGFLPLLSPLYLLPFLGDLATYFVIGSQLPGAQGLFGQYRITLTPFLIWSTIITLSRYKKLNRWYVGAYLLVCTVLVQYMLHLPMSYLTKDWFWQEPPAVTSINTMIRTYLPRNAAVVSQNNITPHVSHRDRVYTLYPEKKEFLDHSPCGEKTCDWFRWFSNPDYLIVDTSPDWDARHLLTDRDPYLAGLHNLEQAGVVVKYKQVGTTVLYKVKENPQFYK